MEWGLWEESIGRRDAKDTAEARGEPKQEHIPGVPTGLANIVP